MHSAHARLVFVCSLAALGVGCAPRPPGDGNFDPFGILSGEEAADGGSDSDAATDAGVDATVDAGTDAGDDSTHVASTCLQCGAECVDAHRDANNCGECGHVCDAAQECVFGKCAPISGALECAGTFARSSLATNGPTTGSVTQSFNETRGIVVTPAADDVTVSAMRLDALYLELDGTVGARIYDATTHALIASQDVSVSAGANLTVDVSISATLRAGFSYVLAFFVSDGGSGGSAVGILPTSLPYAVGPFTVTGLNESSFDAFPQNWNLEAPQITVTACATPSATPPIPETAPTPPPTPSTCTDAASDPLPLAIGGDAIGGQSFNETRALRVSPTASDVLIGAMTLADIRLGRPGTVEARIYDDATGDVVASQISGTIDAGEHLTVSVPISATLHVGSTYLLAFYVSDGGAEGSGTFLQPTFPYAAGPLNILGASESGTNSVPRNFNLFAPQISIVSCSL